MSDDQTIKPIFARPRDEQVALGEIVEISGARASVLLDERFALHCPQIGSLLTVNMADAVVLCLITAMRIVNAHSSSVADGARIVDVELVGELPREPDGYLRTFQRGVSRVPRLGDVVHVPTNEALSKAYQYGPFEGIRVGTIHQNRSIPAVIRVEDLLSKHFAIVGSTGTGKSCTTALILCQLLEKHPQAHVLLLDPHGEYDTCFGTRAELIRPADLCLPFWMLNFEEVVEVLIGNPADYPEEVEILRDLGSGLINPHPQSG